MSASYSGAVAAEVWFTPWDRQPGEIEARITQLLTAARGPVEQNWYVCDLPVIFEATSSLIARAIDTEVTYDHSQWQNQPMQGMVAGLIAANTPWSAAGKALVGTSLHGSINHLKGFSVNVQKGGYTVPDGEYATIDEALAAGYPVTMLGSWNASRAASEQFNVVLFVAGKDISNAFHAALAKLRDYISLNEQHLNPWVTSPPASASTAQTPA